MNTSKTLRICLWLVQAFLAATLCWAASVKLFKPVEEVAAMWPWAGQVPIALLKFTGVVDLLGGLGLILPGLFRIKPKLVPLAALGVLVLMVCASIFHAARGEFSSIGFNVVFAAFAGFIAWGRYRKTPIAAR